jgi:2-deoxy-D-gluconate 3-dehydrogenase
LEKIWLNEVTVKLFSLRRSFISGGIWVPGYAASKGGVKQLAMAFSNEWAGKALQLTQLHRVILLMIIQKLFAKMKVRSKAILDRYSCRRWGTPED